MEAMDFENHTCWESQRSAPDQPRQPEAPHSVDGPGNLLAQVRRFIQNNRYKEAEEVIMAHPELVQMSDEHGNTLLTVAAQNNRKRFVKLFLRHGANIDAQNVQGNSSLHYCSAYNFTEIADYLISKGANPEVRNKSRMLPSEMSSAALSTKLSAVEIPSSCMGSTKPPPHIGPAPSSPITTARSPPSQLSPTILSPPPQRSPTASHHSGRQAPLGRPQTAGPGLTTTSPIMSRGPPTSGQPVSRPATATRKSCVIGGARSTATSMITRTAVPIFHGETNMEAKPPEESSDKRPVQYPTYKFPESNSNSTANSTAKQAVKASENLKSTAVPVFHFQDI